MQVQNEHDYYVIDEIKGKELTVESTINSVTTAKLPTNAIVYTLLLRLP